MHQWGGFYFFPPEFFLLGTEIWKNVISNKFSNFMEKNSPKKLYIVSQN
jgi:hypothetical protein